MQNQGVLGFLELSLGNPAAAADYLGPAARYLHKTRWRDPLGDPKPNAIEALGVDPVSWTPERLRAIGPRREFMCHGPVRRIRRSSASRRSG
jgi:hypothetical protein